MDDISGAYPGGPKRKRDRAPDETPASVETLEDREARLGAVRSRRRRERRTRRLVLGFVAAVLVSAGLGFVLGANADRDSEEIARAREEARATSSVEDAMREETNRVIQQMWLSELLESRGAGGIR